MFIVFLPSTNQKTNRHREKVFKIYIMNKGHDYSYVKKWKKGS